MVYIYILYKVQRYTPTNLYESIGVRIWYYGISLNGIHSFFIRIQFNKNTEGEIWYHFFQKIGNIHPLQKKSMSNETASQEKRFKHIFEG